MKTLKKARKKGKKKYLKGPNDAYRCMGLCSIRNLKKENKNTKKNT